MPTPSIAELQRAVQISEQIQGLEAELASILKGSPSGKLVSQSPKRRGRPRKVQVAEPAGWESGNGRPADGRKKKRKMSAQGRAKIAAAQRARWAKVKSGK